MQTEKLEGIYYKEMKLLLRTYKSVREAFQSYKNIEDDKMNIFKYVYGLCNQTRRYSTFENLSPALFENEFNSGEKLSLGGCLQKVSNHYLLYL
ncbi:MAG: hypothetical protein Q8T08_22230 [Ignavibacteria bacterium]|nr:hypothetical protein [Ignavibacteria bacterium]